MASAMARRCSTPCRTIIGPTWSARSATALCCGTGSAFGVSPWRPVSSRGLSSSSQDGRVTEAAYGPARLLCGWAKGYKEPLHLITNMASADEACRLYATRFRIETFFSDQKSRGFHLHKSHLSAPTRLARLLIAACLAYTWIIYLGALCEQEGWISIIHRGD